MLAWRPNLRAALLFHVGHLSSGRLPCRCALQALYDGGYSAFVSKLFTNGNSRPQNGGGCRSGEQISTEWLTLELSVPPCKPSHRVYRLVWQSYRAPSPACSARGKHRRDTGLPLH